MYLHSKVVNQHSLVPMRDEEQTVSHGKLTHNIEQVVSQCTRLHQQLSVVIRDGSSVELESDDEHKTLVSEFRDEFLIAIDQMGPDAFAAGLLFPAIPLDFNTGLGIKEITEYIDQL